MKYLLTPYSIAQLFTGVVAIIVSVIIWRKRDTRGGWPLFLLFIAVSEWALANGLEAAAVPPELKIFWSKTAYIGAQVSPPLVLLFALQYTGQGRKITPITTGLFFVIPTAIIILAATNDVHGLIWVDFLAGPPGTNSLIYRHGPAFWVSIAFIFSVVAAANALLVIHAIRTQRIYQRQSWIIILASFIPWAGAVIYILGLNPFPGLDIVSISFFFNGLLILYGVTRGRLMDLIPIACEFVFKNLSNAVIVIDEHQRLLDFNPAAGELLIMSSKDMLGAPLSQLVPFWEKIQDLFNRERSTQTEIKYQKLFYGLRVSPVEDQVKRFIGWAVILEDISSRRQAEIELENANRRLNSQLEDINLLQNKLQAQVVRDSLTGVYNRRYLDETLSREIAHASRSGYPLSLIMLDVDHFKKINDQHGHKMGDEVIVAIGQLLQSQTRDSDCVGRYGGDEFLLVMPEMSQEDAFDRAEVWREGIKAMVFQTGDQVVNVTISIGIAVFPENGRRVDDLIKAADRAMYLAKEQGRDRTVIEK
jgi:diguanylate cyclase (GGDEF)-like protein/PAS domain S-box-containing protein